MKNVTNCKWFANRTGFKAVNFELDGRSLSLSLSAVSNTLTGKLLFSTPAKLALSFKVELVGDARAGGSLVELVRIQKVNCEYILKKTRLLTWPNYQLTH